MLRKFGKSGWTKWLPAILAVLGGVSLLWYFLLPGKPDLPPVDAIDQGLKATAQADSYEYKIAMTIVIDGQEQVASTIYGEKENKNRIHIKGQIYNSEVDFYQIDATTYTKDQLTGKWLEITDNQINQQEIFMNELNPLANFSFKELNNVAFAGIQKVGEKKLWVYTANPVIDNRYMEILWKNFQYKFSLEPKSLLINKVEVNAESKINSANKMKVVVEFKNYNDPVKVVPPKA